MKEKVLFLFTRYPKPRAHTSEARTQKGTGEEGKEGEQRQTERETDRQGDTHRETGRDTHTQKF